MSASASSTTRKRRRREPLLCGHCNSLVPHTTFYRHKAKYYDYISNTWETRKSNSNSDSEVEVTHEFEDECSSVIDSTECKEYLVFLALSSYEYFLYYIVYDGQLDSEDEAAESLTEEVYTCICTHCIIGQLTIFPLGSHGD